MSHSLLQVQYITLSIFQTTRVDNSLLVIIHSYQFNNHKSLKKIVANIQGNKIQSLHYLYLPKIKGNERHLEILFHSIS